jgi:peptidoglycan DL-endopeptidase RipA
MPRRVTLIVFLGFVATLVLTTGISAGAAPGEVRSTEAEIAAAQERLMGIRTEQSSAQAAYDAALYKMNDLNEQIADAAEDLDASEARLAEAQKSLEERASQVYKSGNVAFIDVMVGVNNFSEFAARMDLWLRLLAEERAAFDAVLEAKNELAAHKAELEDQRTDRVAAVEEALANKEEAASAEAEAEAYLASLNGELQAEIQAREERRAQRYAQAAAQALEQQAPVEQQATAEAPERVAEVAAVEETPVVPQADTAAQQAAAAEWVTAAQAAAEAAQLEAQRAAERRAAAQAAAEAAAAEAAAAQKAAAQDARQEEREQARIAAERAAARQAEREQAEREAERAARRAAIERAAAERAAEERAAARRAAERQAEREQAEREAERAALREERQAEQRAEEQRAEEQRAEERRAERRAEDRRAAREDASASATATATATTTATADSRRRNDRGGGASSCNNDFGGVAPHVAEAGCDIQARFGLTVHGMGYSSYHNDGLSLDIYTSDRALGNQVRDYVWANYSVNYTIWWDVYQDSTGYTARGHGHFDHVHVTFF